MKKIVLFVFVIAFNFVNAQSGYLSFYSQDGDKFWVIIDGKKINNEPQYNVEKFPVEMKWGKAKIIFEDPKLGTIDKTYQVVDVDGNSCHVKYMIRKNPKKGKYEIRDIDATWEILPASNASINQNTQTQLATQTTQPTQTQVQTQQTNPQTQTIQQSTTIIDPTTNTNINMGVGVNVTETEDGVNMQVHMPGIQTTTQASAVTTTTTTTTTITQPTQQSQVVIKPKPQVQTQTIQEVKPMGGCITPMSNIDFQSAKKSITSKSFEDSKLTTAKQIVSTNCVLSSQVKEIMDIFGFENTRLEFAKFAYKYTYDKNNYYKVNEAFKFESSIDELNEYLNSGN